MFTAVALLMGAAGVSAAPQHALTVYGEPAKYPANFSHFDYTNPQAPKGGTMRRSAIEIGHFDHVLPYIDKGIGVTQIDGLLYSPLAQRSMDEPYTVYGLVAEKMERSEDGLSLRFFINPKARFADGKPITAEDVRYSYDLLMTQGSMRYRTQFEDVKGVTVESPRVVRFDFKNNENRTLPLDIATLPVFPEHWWKSRDFANGGGYEAPLGSGPYRVAKVDSGNSITFARNPDWWGKDLPVSRGLYNFDHFSVEYFGDIDVARQVLRGGAYDYNREFSATGYSIGYDSPALSDGRLQKAHLATEAPQSAQGFVFNLQKPMFQDRRVRQALAPAIVQQIYGNVNELEVIAIEPGLERLLTQALTQGSSGALDPGVADMLTKSAALVANKQEETGMPACLLVPDAIRASMARLLRRAAPRLQVLAHSEIPETHLIRIGPILGEPA